jgi:hypothetical protein
VRMNISIPRDDTVVMRAIACGIIAAGFARQWMHCSRNAVGLSLDAAIQFDLPTSILRRVKLRSQWPEDREPDGKFRVLGIVRQFQRRFDDQCSPRRMRAQARSRIQRRTPIKAGRIRRLIATTLSESR